MCQRRHVGSFVQPLVTVDTIVRPASSCFRYSSPGFRLSSLTCLLGGSYLASCACDHLREGKSLFYLTVYSPSWNQAGTQGTGTEEFYVWSCSTGLSLCSYRTQKYVWSDTTTVDWVLPRQAVIKKGLHRFAYSLIWWRQFLKRPSQVTLVCIKVTKTNTHFLSLLQKGNLKIDSFLCYIWILPDIWNWIKTIALYPIN